MNIFVCEHGSLKRSCLVCELQAENKQLREALKKIAEKNFTHGLLAVEPFEATLDNCGAWEIAEQALSEGAGK